LDPESWSRKTDKDAWNLIELICHLRDTEREIHSMQLKLFNGHDEPFIPRPDSAVWAIQRDYVHEDGRQALQDFNLARKETMEILQTIPDEAWNRKARHAIFGPTNFLEAVSF